MTNVRNKITVPSHLDIFEIPRIYDFLESLFWISNSKVETEGLSDSLVGSDSVVGSWQFQSPLEVFNVFFFFNWMEADVLLNQYVHIQPH